VVQLAAKIAGRIVSMSVDQGDTVRAGQVLLRSSPFGPAGGAYWRWSEQRGR